jgi:hypothetical protein
MGCAIRVDLLQRVQRACPESIAFQGTLWIDSIHPGKVTFLPERCAC